MNNVYKGKAKYILAPVLILLLITAALPGSGKRMSCFELHIAVDTLPPSGSPSIISKNQGQQDSITVSDTSKVFEDSILTKDSIPKQKIDTLNVKMSKDSLDAPVVYHADDSMVLDAPTKKIILYGKKTETKYKDNDLTAPGIEFDQSNNTVTAAIKKDSLGKVISYPTFQQGNFTSISDTIKFNMKTGKGVTVGTYTRQGEIYVTGEKIKKISPDVFYAYRGHFTTCNLDTPHFAFVSNKIEFINQKMAITGPVHPEFEGVPIPIYLPFGIFPLSPGRHSGLLPPVFTANDQLGLALEGLGYYKVLSDNWDVIFRGTLYSYGGWTANLSPTYYKRYHYKGNFSFDYQRFKYNFKGDPDYSVRKTFRVVWNHSMDSKAHPGVTFSANVNAGSDSYNSLVPNNPTLNFTNQLSSSIQFSKVWKDKPFNISITANHNQNSLTKTYSVTLPDVVFNVNTLYPFRRKEVIGNYKWYENIGVALNTDAKSQTFFSSDSTAVSKASITNQVFNNLQWGASHNVPITLSLPQLGFLQIAPSVSYQERWFQERVYQRWDGTKLDTSIQKGFYSSRFMSFGIGLSTRIFGLFAFGKKSKIQAIRHEMRPSISLSYVPDMNSQNYYDLQYDAFGDKRRANYYEGTLYGGAFTETKFAGLNFGIDNNLQMKVRDSKDTSGGGVKKVNLLDGLSINGNYNFLLDSFPLSTFNVSARSNLFNKINITASALLDPYQVNSSGTRINSLIWKNKLLALGRLVNANISLSSQFQGGDQKKTTANKAQQLLNQPYNQTTGLPQNEYETELAYINSNPAEFTDFTIPWSLSVAYSFNVSRGQNVTHTGLTTTTSQNVTWNGSLGLSAKWQVTLNSSYNITLKQLGLVSMSLAREMHCWQMAISISPVGVYRFFNISISPKSGLLRDLKLNRTRYYNVY